MIFSRNKKIDIQKIYDQKIAQQVEKVKDDYQKALATFQTLDPSRVNLRQIAAQKSMASNKYQMLLSAARKRNASGYIQKNIINFNKK